MLLNQYSKKELDTTLHFLGRLNARLPHIMEANHVSCSTTRSCKSELCPRTLFSPCTLAGAEEPKDQFIILYLCSQAKPLPHFEEAGGVRVQRPVLIRFSECVPGSMESKLQPHEIGWSNSSSGGNGFGKFLPVIMLVIG